MVNRKHSAVTTPARLLAGAGLLLMACRLGAVELLESSFEFDGKTYSFRYAAKLTASQESVFGVITDHEHLHRTNDNIIKSGVLERYSDLQLKRFIQVDRCVLSFCFELHFVENVKQTRNRLTASMIADESTFKDGVAEWYVDGEHAGSTILTVRASQTLDLWVPPGIGEPILRRIFHDELVETLTNVERLAMVETQASLQ